MAADGFAVVLPELRAHAGKVAVGADALARARSAFAAIDPDPTMYGELLTWLPPLIGLAQELAVAALRDTEATLRDTSERLSAVASAYARNDTQAARTLLRAS